MRFVVQEGGIENERRILQFRRLISKRIIVGRNEKDRGQRKESIEERRIKEREGGREGVYRVCLNVGKMTRGQGRGRAPHIHRRFFRKKVRDQKRQKGSAR